MITYEFTNKPDPHGETFYNISLVTANKNPVAVRQQTYVNTLSRAAERAAMVSDALCENMPSPEMIVVMAAALTLRDGDIR